MRREYHFAVTDDGFAAFERVVAEGIAAHNASVSQTQADYGASVKALDTALEDDKIAALVAVIDAIPDEAAPV